MICPKCLGGAPLEFGEPPFCDECGGCGIVHCCEGECVDLAEKKEPPPEEVK